MTSHTRFARSAVAVMALSAYAVTASALLSLNTSSLYGFPVQPGLGPLMETAIETCPMLAAVIMVLISPLRDRITQQMTARLMALSSARWSSGTCLITAIVLINLTIAAAVLMAMSASLLLIRGDSRDLPHPTTLLLLAVNFLFDLTMIGVFTHFIYALTRRLWLSLLLFFCYSAAVVFVGPRFGITSYIGFASTPSVFLTSYSAIPIYYGTGWLFRAYWVCVTMFMLSVLFGFDHPPAPLLALRGRQIPPEDGKRGRPAYVSLTVLALCVLFAVSLLIAQRAARGEAGDVTVSALASQRQGKEGDTRPRLTHFDIQLLYEPARKEILLEGTLAFVNEEQTASLRSLWFRMPEVVDVHHFQIDGLGEYEWKKSGRLLRLTPHNTVPPGARLQLRYSGVIRSSGFFDRTIPGKVMERAFFLTASDVLFAARRLSCLSLAQAQKAGGTKREECTVGENYLMADAATGQISVTAPQPFDVVTVGTHSIRKIDDRLSAHTFRIEEPHLTAFLIACAPFRKMVASYGSSETRVSVYRPASAALEDDKSAAMAGSMLSYYESVWPGYARKELLIVEIPTHLGKALSFDGMIAISDTLIASRDPLSGTTSSLLEFVLAHEIAHQWWGFRMVPERSPGRLFLVESFAQFAAYKYLDNRGTFKDSDGLRNERKRYEIARTRIRAPEVPLVELEQEDYLAYHKGPFVLLLLDAIAERQLIGRLSGIIGRYSYYSHGVTSAKMLISSMIEELPESARETGRLLLCDVVRFSASIEDVSARGHKPMVKICFKTSPEKPELQSKYTYMTTISWRVPGASRVQNVHVPRSIDYQWVSLRVGCQAIELDIPLGSEVRLDHLGTLLGDEQGDNIVRLGSPDHVVRR